MSNLSNISTRGAVFHEFNPSSESPTDEVQNFITRWGLDQNSLNTLVGMAPEVQRDVLSSFHPQDATQNVNKLFLSFCRSRSTGRLPGSAAAAAGLTMSEKQAHHIDFFNSYGLNETSQNALLALPVELQAEVLVNFRPRDTTRDANSLFLAFIKSRTSSRFPQLSAALTQTRSKKPAFFAPPQPTISMMFPQQPIGAAFTMVDPSVAAAYAQMNQPVMVPLTADQFAMAWSLNEISLNLLRSMPPNLQADVMQNFQPRDPTRDVNGVFLSFAKSRMQTSGLTLPNISFAPPPVTVGMPTFGGNSLGMLSMPGSPKSGVSRTDFARAYGLSREALTDLDELSHPMQQKMMTDFLPRDNTRDPNKLFMSFVKSRIATTFADLFKLNAESLELFNSLDPTVQSDVVKNFAPKGQTRDMNSLFQHFVRSRASGGGMAKGTKRNLDMLNCDDKVSAFVQQWDLKPENIEFLQAMTPDQQDEVISKFYPRDPARDCNGVFRKFATMVANQ
eukprot:GEMP01029100.1.p1 GENE.GEMP01029100.1~~GEMP01029100.1.p1  ORF type:complete len:505 (+),score=87.05 GEMP01029100.1:213-1727(+)